MAEELVWFGVRFTHDAWANFVGACECSRLTNRSGLEAAIELVHLFCSDPRQRRALFPDVDPEVFEGVVMTAWRYAAGLEDRHRTAREQRAPLNIRTEAWRVEALRRCIEEHAHGISMNAAIASVFTPWGHDWNRGSKEAYELRIRLWEWAAERGRARDQGRSRKRTVPAAAAMVVSRIL